MDLAKIIAELRAELRCLDGAITSMEELARVQSLPDSGGRHVSPPEPQPPSSDPPPAKRGRGRPRKNPLPVPLETPGSLSSNPVSGDADSTASAA